MAQDSGQSRTEAATPRRREEARKQGQIALSQDTSTAVLLLGAALTFWLGGQLLSGRLADALRQALISPAAGEWRIEETTILARWVAGGMLQSAGWIAGALIALSVGAAVIQGGVTLTLKPLSIDWARLSPERNLQRLFSWNGAVKGLLAAAKVAVILACFCWCATAQVDLATVSGRNTLWAAVHSGWTSTLAVFAWSAGALLALALLDLLFQRLRHEHDLRMTREELKQEQKEDEGDPHRRAHIRKRQREAAEQRGIADVPSATVVVTNPTHFAVALRYDRDISSAPQVVAKGSGLIARRIIRIAESHGVPVIERKPLARLLFRVVSVGQEIPVELYQAVAEILAQVYRVKRGGGAAA